MLPFLKKKQEGSMAEDEDESEDFGIIDAVASDMMEAFEKKDRSLLKQALDALCEYVRAEDQKQDSISNQ